MCKITFCNTVNCRKEIIKTLQIGGLVDFKKEFQAR